MAHKFCPHCMEAVSEDVCKCGKKPSEYQSFPHHLQPGTILGGKYLIGAVLGEGGFGITYIGRDINLEIKVAVKEYFPSGAVNRNNTSSTEITAHTGDAGAYFKKGKESFLGEARTLAKFCNEPNVVSVRDFFSENNTAYIVMEYLEGTDLKDYIKQHGKLSFEDAVTLLSPIMKALAKIHSHGLIHRDISPANIMILNDGTVKLLDFGAAREVGGADEKSLSILLKPGFAPEEQYRTKGHQGPWTDVYAISATMYKMITGVTPLDAMNRVFSDDLDKITEKNPSVTEAQEAVILKGMAVHQQNRYQSVNELYNECQKVLGKEQVNINPQNNGKKQTKPVAKKHSEPTSVHSKSNSGRKSKQHDQQNKKLSISQAFATFFKSYLDFKGKTSKSDYWRMFWFVIVIPFILLAMINPALGAIYAGAVIIPGVSLTVRRLHDRKDGSENNRQAPETSNDVDGKIYSIIKSHAPVDLTTAEAKRIMDEALFKIVPTYTGTGDLSEAMMLCDPVNVVNSICEKDEDSLIVLLKAFEFYIGRSRDKETVAMFKDSAFNVLKALLLEKGKIN